MRYDVRRLCLDRGDGRRRNAGNELRQISVMMDSLTFKVTRAVSR